jgi:hypothetical protein
MVFQAYIDDSYRPDGMFVLGGYIASAENWAKFASEWEELLTWGGVLHKSGVKVFKMNEMMQSTERMERIPAFRKVAEKHALLSVSCSFEMAAHRRALSRIYVPGKPIDFGWFRNPYLFCFRALMDKFHNSKQMFEQFLALDEPVNFVFDEQTEKKMVLEAWESYLAARPMGYRDLYGSTPKFENDLVYLPLQAADLWAGQTRIWKESGEFEAEMDALSKGEPIENCARGAIAIEFSEDDITEGLCQILAAQEPSLVVVDLKKFTL